MARRDPKVTPMPEAFVAALKDIKACIAAEKPHGLQFDRREQRIAVIDRLLQSDEIAYHTDKALRLPGSLEILCHLTEAAALLPEQLAATDTRTSDDRKAYLEDVKSQIKALVKLLGRDQPSTSELDQDKPTAGQWPPHPFYRDSLLEELQTPPFRLGRYLDLVGPGKAQTAGTRARFPFANLRHLLSLLEKPLIKAIKAVTEGTDLQKGNGALRLGAYTLSDALQPHGAFFEANPRRISRDGLIAAFLKAACAHLYDFSVMHLTHQGVHAILRDREHPRRRSTSTKRARKRQPVSTS
jgi:hypothetical protein